MSELKQAAQAALTHRFIRRTQDWQDADNLMLRDLSLVIED